MTTTEFIRILSHNEKGSSGRSREISFTINGIYVSEPEIKLSSTGDGIAGAEIDFDVTGSIYDKGDKFPEGTRLIPINVLQDILQKIIGLTKSEPARYMPSFDAYKQCFDIVKETIEEYIDES